MIFNVLYGIEIEFCTIRISEPCSAEVSSFFTEYEATYSQESDEIQSIFKDLVERNFPRENCWFGSCGDTLRET